MDLLQSLIVVSEKAANIARLCRQNEHLFQLLIQQKTSEEANPRFVEDFKTLADVLIQELVKHDIGNEFPDLKSSIFGEEDNVFSNTLGDTIKVEIKQTQQETSNLLKTVLGGNSNAADLLAVEVHKKVFLEDVNTPIPMLHLNYEFDLSDLGIWIDPIDSTAEYINNGVEEISSCGIIVSGLKCVTVLIGAYNKTTGLPVVGVVNQPFIAEDNDTFSGVCFWGISSPSRPLTSFSSTPARSRIICASASENPEITDKLSGFEIVEASGAGYKILSVISGAADAYVLSKSSTFKWDTCGPQAILRALGGDIVVFNEALQSRLVSVKYGMGGNCNEGGVIAYRDKGVLEEIIKNLSA